MPAALHRQAAHLGQAARHEHGGRVVAVTQTIRHAHGDGDDVLERGAQLHARDVVACVSAERRRGEQVAEHHRRVLARRRDDGTRRLSLDDLLGMIRARKHRQAVLVAQLGLEHAHGQVAAFGLHTLRADDDRELIVHHIGQRARHAAQQVRGRHDNGGLRAQQRIAVRGGCHDVIGQLRIRKVTRVDVLVVDAVHHRILARPQAHVMPVEGQRLRQRSSPRTGADDCNLHVVVHFPYASLSFFPMRRSLPARRRAMFSRCAHTTVSAATVVHTHAAGANVAYRK